MDQLNSLMKDEAFTAKLDVCQSLEEVSALLKDNGVDMSEAQLQDLVDKSEGELNEDVLEDVAGGYIKPGGLIKLLEKLLGKKFSGGGHRF